VVPRPGARPEAGELIESCRERLSNYKVPRQIELRASLPRNAAGKPLKRRLKLQSR
jgi:acyl-CoA synthetase (AMP-forming)/AMP-acid ligase II